MQVVKKWGTDMTIIVTNEMKNEATSKQKDGYRLGRYKKLDWDPCTARNDSHLSNASIYIYIDLRFLDRYCVIYQQPISRDQPVSGSTKKASHSTHFHAEEWCGHSVHSRTFPGARQPSSGHQGSSASTVGATPWAAPPTHTRVILFHGHYWHH